MADVEIRHLIATYLAGEISAEQLESELEDLAWQPLEGPAGDVANSALLVLAEHQNGDWTDAELQSQLINIARTYWIDRVADRTSTAAPANLILEERQTEASDKWLVAASV